MDKVQEALEKLSEAFVFAEPSDLPSLADLHTGLEGVQASAADASEPLIASAAGAAARLVEKIVLGEMPDARSSLDAVGRTVSALQLLARGGCQDTAVIFPPELGLDRTPRGKDDGAGTGAPLVFDPATRPAPAEPSTSGDAQQGPEEQNAAAPKVITLSGDLGLLRDFVSEATEHLEAADVHLLTLETDTGNAEALNAVFRAFHTIKGVAGFLALEHIQALAHEAENLLDHARKGELALAGAAIDVTFDAVDTLKALVSALGLSLATGEPLDGPSELPGLLERIRAVAAGRPGAPSESDIASFSGERLGEILVAAGKVKPEQVDSALERQREEPQPKKLGEILIESNVVSRSWVNAALRVQQQEPEVGKIGEVLVRAGTADVEHIDAALQKQQQPPAKTKLGELLVKDGEVAAKDVAQALRSQKTVARQPTVQIREPVKVDADRLDRLVDTIGELVIAESMVSQSTELKTLASAQLVRQLSLLDKITRELQEMATSLRMVPVRSTFQKMARVVHDLAKKSGKSVDFIMSGEDTELDKTVVDKIGDPLVHMVRNAVDHGIEASIEERGKAGKPTTGRIELRAYHKGGSIYIEVEDDGRGLDRDTILAKARERGLVHEGEMLSEREIYSLVFAPGLSTAKSVTAVSGRGVGMDVVKKSIDALRGQVEIQSELGHGTVFSIRLPLTLAIIDGMVVRVGQERYIIPTLSIIRSIRPEAKQISTVLGRGEMISLHNKLIPLFRLDRLFDVGAAQQDVVQALVVVVEDDACQAGLLIDELLGQQQIVIKSLGETMQGIAGVAGGAIMPDGQVGLILDVGGLVRLANAGNGASIQRLKYNR